MLEALTSNTLTQLFSRSQTCCRPYGLRVASPVSTHSAGEWVRGVGISSEGTASRTEGGRQATAPRSDLRALSSQTRQCGRCGGWGDMETQPGTPLRVEMLPRVHLGNSS